MSSVICKNRKKLLTFLRLNFLWFSSCPWPLLFRRHYRCPHPGTREAHLEPPGTPLGAPNPYDAIAAKRDTTRTAISLCQRFHLIHSFNALFEQSFIRRIIVHEREAQYLSSIEGRDIFLQGIHVNRDYTSSVP